MCNIEECTPIIIVSKSPRAFGVISSPKLCNVFREFMEDVAKEIKASSLKYKLDEPNRPAVLYELNRITESQIRLFLDRCVMFPNKRIYVFIW